MKSDDDVEKLFSWLQTPDIRYREFAGAREVTDTRPTRQTRSNTVEEPEPVQGTHLIHEEALRQDDQVTQSEAVAPPAPPHAQPTPAASTPVSPASAPPPSEPPASEEPADQTSRPLDTVFNRLAGGRGGDRDPTKGRPR